MADFFVRWLTYTWNMIHESALLLWLGFILAGIIRALIRPAALKSIFGRSRYLQIVTASLAGIPLPLCSCSVLPVAAQLRRSGLSREGTVSFLISTPETGADSIALSFKLLGPVFAVVRPVAALFTALISGLVTGFLAANKKGLPEPLPMSAEQEDKSLWHRLKEGQIYVFTDLAPELAYYLFWGYLLAGLAAALIPADLLRSGLSPWLQYIGVIVVSLPVYVCATSSTPLAAVLLTLGLLPGAVLTFMMVGPATNLTSLVVQKKILGLRGMIVMTISVVAGAVFCGLIFDYATGGVVAGFSPEVVAGRDEIPAWYDLIAAAILIFFMVYYTGRHYIKIIRKKLI